MSAALRSRWVTLAVLVAVGIFALWPVSALGEHGFIRRDTFFALVVIEHLQAALLGAAHWLDAPLAWPMRWGTTQFDWVGGLALLALPLDVLGLTPFQQHGALVLLAYVSCGMVVAEAARALLGPGPHTWAAGVLGGMSPAHLAESWNLNLVHHELGLAGVVLVATGVHRRQPLLAGLGGLMVGLAGHFGVYVGLHAALMAVVVLAVALLARRLSTGLLAAVALGGLAGALTMAPVLGAFAESSALYGIEYSERQRTNMSLLLTSTMMPSPQVEWHVRLAEWVGHRPRTLSMNPGYASAILAAIGLHARVRRGWSWLWTAAALTVLVGGALSLGPVVQTHFGSTGIPGPALLLEQLPGMRSLRAPQRWLAVGLFALGLFGAAGVQALIQRGRRGQLLALGLGVLVLVELPEPQRVGTAAEVAVHPVYDAVAILEIPGALYDVRASAPGDGTDRVRAQLRHRRPRAGGTYARTSRTHEALNQLALSWPRPAADTLFRVAGITVVLERSAGRRALTTPPDDATCRSVAGHRLCTLPPWPGIPARVTTEPGPAPTVGLRFDAPLPEEVALSCDGEVFSTQRVAWRLITELQHGVHAAWTDVFLPTPCEGTLTSPEGGEPLFAVGEQTWARPLWSR